MKKHEKGTLGKAIQNKLDRKHRVHVTGKAPIFYQETEQNDAEVKKQKMKSVLEQNSMTEFLQIAELSQQNFKANRDLKFREIREEVKQKKIIMIDNKAVMIEDQIDQLKLKGLQMPKRPNWKDAASKEELTHKESQAYLNWRRNLAMLEESSTDIRITPYEKNIEVWKQLWRVTERADLMVQIVDGRDPLFFRSEDLNEYVKQLNPDKKSLLLINKSDLVPEEVRERWNKYFLQNDIPHLFFSAKLAAHELQAQDEVSEATIESEVVSEQKLMQHYFNKPHILTIEELISIFNHYTVILSKQKIQVGLVGYPNVGKSSVINALFGKKKVGVASMPGKTKHFQTLKLSEKVTLCDCPGLVFPRISSSHAYMVLNGLYPIDTIKSFTEPIRILVQRIPQQIIEQVYSLFWKQNEVYECDTLLNKFAQLKGVFTGNGLPNQSFAAKILLKDYVSGILVYARNPPGLQGQQIITEEPIKMTKNKEQQVKFQKTTKNLERQIDSQFFKQEAQEKIIIEDSLKDLTEDDLLDIVEGKKISGVKITKQMRKNIKHAMKRGEKIEQIKKKYLEIQGTNDCKQLVKVQ